MGKAPRGIAKAEHTAATNPSALGALSIWKMLNGRVLLHIELRNLPHGS